MMKGLAESFKPTTFLSVHSGTLGMYMPWAWSPDKVASRNQQSMVRVLKAADQRHCKCPFGGAGKEVGYPAPGTSVDWIFDKLRTPYAFAFEIWTDPKESASLVARWEEKMQQTNSSFLQEHGTLAHEHFR